MNIFIISSRHGAKVIGGDLRGYFSSARNIYMGQKLLQRTLGHDCLFAGIPDVELHFFGTGEEFFIRDIEECEAPNTMLDAIELLSREDMPVIGYATSPFRICSMIYREGNEEFIRNTETVCKKWINAQIKTGADIVILFDNATNREDFKENLEFYSRISGKKVWYSGGEVTGIIDLIEKAGFGMATVNSNEKISSVRERTDIRLSGNLSASEMPGWDEKVSKEKVIKCIEDGLIAGNFVLSADGEIPYYTGFLTLRTIVRTARDFLD